MSNKYKEKSRTPYLDKYTEDLTAKVRKNIEDFEAYGREREIKKVLVSLVRLHKNSPTLVGEAGVGKTHIVEGVCASIIRKRNIPKEFENVRVRSLSLSAITSKTKNQNGEEEDIISKLHHIVEELKAHKEELNPSDTLVLSLDLTHDLDCSFSVWFFYIDRLQASLHSSIFFNQTKLFMSGC